MMKRSLMAILMILIGIGFVLGDTQSVFAQGSELDEFTLEEITVTAQKREEDLQKVPVAIETISGADLTDWGRTDFSDAFTGITTVKVQQTTRGFIISMRGMSDDQGGQNSPVTVNIDGDYTRRQEVGLMGLLDMERIEVLNGPQGILYGRLATGGAINLVTASPTDRFEANGLIEYGSYSLMRTQGILNVPVNEKWALRAAFQTVLRDGYMDNGEMDADEKSGRIKARFSPNDDFTLTLTGEKSKTGGVGTGDVKLANFIVRGFTAPEPHDTCFSRYALSSVRLSLSFSSSVTTTNSQGCRLLAEGALIDSSRICSIISRGTESFL